MRKPFQGVGNIVRFNWPFYAVVAAALLILLAGGWGASGPYRLYLAGLAGAILLGTAVSLGVSWYVYDQSNLYALNWLTLPNLGPSPSLATINAGFDETSALLKQHIPQARLHVFDFYNPDLHTEASIRRARVAYPAYPGTVTIDTATVPLDNQSTDAVLLLLAAHEIRQDAERVRFFAEIRRVLKPDGQVIVVEHLRNLPNFLAYSIGFLHFLSLDTWRQTFGQAGFHLSEQSAITPFITVFRLEKDGTAP